MDRDARSPDLLSSLVAPSAGPITWPHEYDALVNAIPMNASTGGQFARVKTDAYVPLEIDHASRTAAVDVIIGADNKSGRNAAQHGTSPPTLKLGMSNFVPTSSGAIAPVSETASPLSVGLSNGPDSALPMSMRRSVSRMAAQVMPTASPTAPSSLHGKSPPMAALPAPRCSLPPPPMARPRLRRSATRLTRS